MQFEFLEQAEKELEEAVVYYEDKQNGLGRALIEEVYSTVKLATTLPTIGAKVHRQARRLPMKRFPYAVIYVPQNDRLIILAIMHHRRQPDYWKKRYDF